MPWYKRTFTGFSLVEAEDKASADDRFESVWTDYTEMTEDKTKEISEEEAKALMSVPNF